MPAVPATNWPDSRPRTFLPTQALCSCAVHLFTGTIYRLEAWHLIISLYIYHFLSNFKFSWLNESLSAFIGSEQEMISLANLAAFPQFLRFGEVELCYNKTSLQSIAEKCHTFVECLQSIQAPLNDSASILICAEIDKEKPSQFGDYSTLLNHIRGELMPICDSSRQYSFFIDFGSDKTQRVNVIESILTIPQIVRCSNILIEVCQGANPLQLPVKAIAQWLNQTDDRSRIGVIDDQKKQEKFLRIGTEHDKIRNVLEMCKHLTEVLVHF